MKHILIVAFGGAIGTILRFLIGRSILHHTENFKFPIGTFVINILGCFIAGLFAGLIIKNHLLNMNMRLLLLTGFLGGFTTLSAFAIETFYLIQRNELSYAITYSVLTFFGCFLVLWLGFYIVKGGIA